MGQRFWSRPNTLPFLQSSRPVKAQVAYSMPTAHERAAPCEENLEIGRDLKEASKVEYCEGADVITAFPLGEDLPSQCQLLAEIALEEPPSKPVVSLPGGWVDHEAASTVSGPWSPALLKP